MFHLFLKKFALSLIFLTSVAKASNSLEILNDFTESCGKIESVRGAEYCIHSPKGEVNQDILYYFHGLEGNVKIWPTFEAGLLQEWKKRNLKPPIVVTISFGPVWFLTENGTSSMENKIQSIIDKAIPWIETTFKFQFRNRLMLGISMGGYNALQVLHNKPELFSKVALGCPAIPTVSPYSPWESVKEYIRRTSANPFNIWKALKVSRMFFPNEESWQKGNPLKFEKGIGKHFPKIYIGAANKDEYGFQEGDLIFADKLKKEEREVTLSYFEGKHCWSRPNEITDFLFQ